MAPPAPVSKSPMLATSLPVTPKDGEKAAAAVLLSLDDKVEYLDFDGIPRRSETITRRMILRGHVIDQAMVMDEDEQAHRSRSTRANEAQEKDDEVAKQLLELEKKQKANADFKRKNKMERQQWIDESDELIVTRLKLSYDGKNAPPGDEHVDTTESNTVASPSKKAQVFIDTFGNLRRKSTPKVELNPADTVVINVHDSETSGSTKLTSSQPASPVEATRPADPVK